MEEKDLEKERKDILNYFKQIIESKSDLMKKQKKQFKIEYKKYKQLVHNEKILEEIFVKLHGNKKLQEYKKLFQSDDAKNKIYARYFQLLILKSQVKDLKEFFNKDYYNEMSRVAKAIYYKEDYYNFYTQKELDLKNLENILKGTDKPNIKNDYFKYYNKGTEKINTFSL